MKFNPNTLVYVRKQEKMIHTYSVFLSVSQRQDSLYVQEEFASVE